MLRPLIVIVLAALSLAGTPALAAADARYFGFSDNAVARGEMTSVRDSALLALAGANSARVSLEWRFIERAPKRFDWGLSDDIYRAITRRGMRPLLLIMSAPRWAWPPWVLCPSRDCHYPPGRSHDAEWERFVTAVAKRYPAAAGIEVFNEPNIRLFWRTGPDPQRYTELLRIAHDAVKRVNPRMPVLGGSFTGDRSDQMTGDAWGTRPFLRGMYAAGARGLMDGISLHPYPGGRYQGGTYETIDRTLQVRDEAHDRVPLWLTEIGMTTTGAGAVTPRQQGVVLADLVPRLMRRPDVAAVYVHTLLAPQKLPRGDPESGYGVLRTPTQPKPAFCALAHAMSRTAPRCTPVVRPPAPLRALWDAQEALQAAVETALAYRRRTGTYSGLSSATLHKLNPRIPAAAPDVAAPPVADTDRRQIAVIDMGSGVRLCNASPVGRSFCVTIFAHGDWRFTALRGPISAAATAADSADSPQW